MSRADRKSGLAAFSASTSRRGSSKSAGVTDSICCGNFFAVTAFPDSGRSLNEPGISREDCEDLPPAEGGSSAARTVSKIPVMVITKTRTATKVRTEYSFLLNREPINEIILPPSCFFRTLRRRGNRTRSFTKTGLHSFHFQYGAFH